MIDFAEVSASLGTVVSIFTALGGIGVWQYRKQNKRLKDAEVLLSEVQVEKARMETKADDWHIWKEQCETLMELNKRLTDRNKELVEMNADKEDRHQKDIKDWEERFDSQTDRLREVQRALVAANEREVELAKDNSRLQKERDHYFFWRCFREEGQREDQCWKKRKPKQSVPVPYTPLIEGEDKNPEGE